MLTSLNLVYVDPCQAVPLIDFGERRTVRTTNIGLGKTLLDTIWWLLTRRWPASLDAHMMSVLMIDAVGSLDDTSTFDCEPTVADAICDRLFSNSETIELKGDSLRRFPPKLDPNLPPTYA